MRLLDFSYNDFSSQVPPRLGNCSRLKSFQAGYSNLLRSLPDDIYAAASLEEPSLHFNKLSGFISNDIINLTSLLVLELYSKELIGSIPRDIGKLTNLKYLLLYRNNLSGSLPSSMMNCTNLKTLNLMGNLFAGNLSAYNFSVLSQLETIDLYINMFTGSFLLTLTSCRILMGCKNLNVLFLTMNFMNEATPNYDQNKISDGFQNLRAVSLAGCQLTGQVPLWLSKLTKLEVLLLSRNQITGSIPGWFGNLPSLFYFALSQNNISGEFPKELSRLQPLVIEQNKFNRNKPDLPFFLFPNQNSTSHQYNRIFGLRPTIFLANNSLSGRIPAETGQLKFLNVLDLGNNNFAGSIPNQISQLTILERLDLSKNHLSGEIPASLSSLHFLSFFSTAENNMQGPIPSGGQLHTFPPSSFEGNPEFCSDIANRSSTTQPRTTTNIGLPSKSSNNMDLCNGLIAGTVFGFIIGSVTGIVYSLPKLKLLQLMLNEG
ncbi:Tyrosine-sulfated glycopeptide receptor 1 [Citrus sinensis]|nr:Tyrosine-sulfated glycopeptide receptor 1 [Citrus sinensis]